MAPHQANTEKPDLPSVVALREQILRRIMRVACVAGVFGMVAGAMFVRPFDVVSLVIAAAATVTVFGLTLLPGNRRVVSTIYPWAMVIVGVCFAWVGSPRTDPFLMIAGGLFIASLMLTRAQLAALLVLLAAAAVGVVFASGKVWTEDLRSDWVSASTTMVAVVAPAAIAGRILVSVLAQALSQRESLVQRLVRQGEEREQALRALEHTRTQLTHAQKMDLIGQMAGGIAHDMNNALMAVMGEASMLDDSVRDERERIVGAAIHAANLTQQLMVFGRKDVSQPRPIDLTANVRTAIRAIRRVIPSEIELRSQLPDVPIVVVADPTQVLQVLLNLAGNARDAIGTSGRIGITLRADEQARCAIIEVSDTGAGIPDRVLPHIFEPFFTTKPAGQGTGLGLANVRQIVEGQGGRVEVRSAVGEGTTFSLRMPMSNERVNEECGASPRPVGRGGTVLVVDDDVRVRAIVFTALERLGYRVLEAASPDAAVALAQSAHGGIDLLLTDVVMPGGGGAGVIERLRALYPTIPVLVISGYSNDETLRRGVSQGMFPFLAKPFTVDALAVAVERTMAT